MLVGDSSSFIWQQGYVVSSYSLSTSEGIRSSVVRGECVIAMMTPCKVNLRCLSKCFYFSVTSAR